MQPNTIALNESGFSTTDTKFAATLLLFGCRLNHPNNALDATLQYASKEAYLRSRKDPSIKPIKKVAWNFGHMPVMPRELFAAYSSKDSDEQFEWLLTGMAQRVIDELDKRRKESREGEMAPTSIDAVVVNLQSGFNEAHALADILTSEISKIKSSHSAAVAQSCREVLEAREYLISIIQRIPPLAWEIVVWGKGNPPLPAKFPQNATIEVQTSHLNNIS